MTKVTQYAICGCLRVAMKMLHSLIKRDIHFIVQRLPISKPHDGDHVNTEWGRWKMLAKSQWPDCEEGSGKRR